jgi:3'-phosphoadenosine 5'-phosphosulfate sulfotransferase (PAPS reductase)/FAD synthetase
VTDQVRLLPGAHPDELVAAAKAEHRPIRTFCLFSGGNDSMAVAHRLREHYDELVWIDTGTAVPGVREFVEHAADWLGKPLRALGQDFDAYRLLVLGGMDRKGRKWHVLGFPGPAQHGRAYNRLKERPLEQLLRETKEGHPRSARVMALTSIRRAESQRRRGRQPINRKGSMVFVNPLIDWTASDLFAYRAAQGLPESDVAALLHRSGECNCGSFAGDGEREMLRSLWPEWFDQRIGALEREAEAMGLPCARWGERCVSDEDAEPAGELCSDCQLRLEDAA